MSVASALPLRDQALESSSPPFLWWDSWGDQGLGGTSWKPVSALACLPPFLPTPEHTDTRAGPRTPRHPWPPVYRGCMRNLVVNWSPVTMSHSAGVQGVVGASGCPAT